MKIIINASDIHSGGGKIMLNDLLDAALQRIDDGSYGYCEETGDPIGLNRLEARPVATLSIDAQERHERMEKTYTDD